MTDTKTLSAYERMTVAELQALARTRGLNFTTKTRKPELIKLLEAWDTQRVTNVTVSPVKRAAIAPLGTPEDEMFPVRHGALKLSPARMRLNYARQNTRNPRLTYAEAVWVKLTAKQLRAIGRRLDFFVGANLDVFKPFTS